MKCSISFFLFLPCLKAFFCLCANSLTLAIKDFSLNIKASLSFRAPIKYGLAAAFTPGRHFSIRRCPDVDNSKCKKLFFRQSE